MQRSTQERTGESSFPAFEWDVGRDIESQRWPEVDETNIERSFHSKKQSTKISNPNKGAGEGGELRGKVYSGHSIC